MIFHTTAGSLVHPLEISQSKSHILKMVIIRVANGECYRKELSFYPLEDFLGEGCINF